MRLSTTLLSLVALVPGQSGAQPPSTSAAAPTARRSPPSIPRATFIADMNAEFASFDGNHDGKATAAEISARIHEDSVRKIQARNRTIFKALDTDHNGQLSAAEFARFTVTPGPGDAAPLLKRLDSNHDAVVSAVEYRAGTLANFDRLDTDKDGIVTPAEMKAGGIIRR